MVKVLYLVIHCVVSVKSDGYKWLQFDRMNALIFMIRM